jgi:hypothetical protein
METYKYLRAAQAGDVCILLLPTEQELARLREYQSRLQAVFGGHIAEHVHVTCQRFKPDHPEQIWQIVNKLSDELAMVEPFPLMVDSTVTLNSEFWQSCLARWQVRETAEWQLLNSGIRRVLKALACQPHYHGDKMPTCSALEQIPVGSRQSDLLGVSCPELLFEARQVIITQIDSPGVFTTLKTSHLGPGISEKP